MPSYTVTVTVPAPGGQAVNSRDIIPNLGYNWKAREFSCVAPAGTNGAILWQQDNKLRKVDGIGEFTSLEWLSTILISAASPLVARVIGTPVGDVQINIIYEQEPENP